MSKKKNIKRIMLIVSILILVFCFIGVKSVLAAPNISVTTDGINIGTSDNPEDVSSSIQILILLTVLAIAPSILIMMTGFTRIIIILSFLRNALGTQQMPPNQVMIGLALFITFFVMSPVLTDINENAFQPYTNGTITQKQAIDSSSKTIKTWMVKQIFSNGREKDLALFMTLAGQTEPIKVEEAPNLSLTIVVPAFLISELTVAFKFGFLIFLPFLIIDMVVSSTLMSMGMMMLPPSMISLPFKVLLFILVDGWGMITQSIIISFSG
ncbi:flagellar type III secretion system pore protein FliP [Ruminiclostridium herbifermentans]|uniref:Flagellar biosynthetic protein FliP n=1 Tax=Ruminiclostridium herbifermentans TaxID=2488810 RepID=A0A4U7JL64_9FIRM|nr:flagellar type III secretion system pore protein FliP [Ruminiclostridium herbifermentans]QNU68400.1 flagellar type III secretion system pore protein FliP [Ruminiclostridium herbifermentans]